MCANDLICLCSPELNLDLIDHHGNTAVQIACQLRHADIAKILLDAGADPTIANALGWTCRGESQHSQSPKLAMDVLEANGNTYYRKFRERLPRLFKALAAVSGQPFALHIANYAYTCLLCCLLLDSRLLLGSNMVCSNHYSVPVEGMFSVSQVLLLGIDCSCCVLCSGSHLIL